MELMNKLINAQDAKKRSEDNKDFLFNQEIKQIQQAIYSQSGTGKNYAHILQISDKSVEILNNLGYLVDYDMDRIAYKIKW